MEKVNIRYGVLKSYRQPQRQYNQTWHKIIRRGRTFKVVQMKSEFPFKE